MQVPSLHLALAAVFLHVALVGSSPIQKVVTMMTDMVAKARQEKQDEQVRYAAFSQFCEGANKEREIAIGKGKSAKASYEADIEKAQSDVMQLGREITITDRDVAAWTSDKASAIASREEQHKLYEEEHKELVDSIIAVNSAIREIRAKAMNRHDSLLQLSMAAKVPVMARQALASFLQGDPLSAMLQDASEWGAPEAKSFESSSGGVLNMAENLGDKFQDEKDECEKMEQNAQHAHNMLVADLDNQVARGNKNMEVKASMKAELEQSIGINKGALFDASSTLAEDEKFLEDLKAECDIKAKDFHQRQLMRQGEIDAILKAIEIMSNDDVTGVASFIQRVKDPHRASFIQLRSPDVGDRSGNAVQKAVARFLQIKAAATGSRVLAILAERASVDPFVKVSKMIKNMITKLLTEANEEATHKGFCDSEMSTNKISRDQKYSQADKLKSKIELLAADIQKLARNAADAAEQIAEIDGQTTKAQNERGLEKDGNAQTIKEAKLAHAAVARATVVLREYYHVAGNQKDLPEPEGAISWDARAVQILTKARGGGFMQKSSAIVKKPEMESGKYTGMENGGVIGMLEIIESDFANLISDTQASEEHAAKLHDKFLADSAQDKAVKLVDLAHFKSAKVKRELDLTEAKESLRATSKELTAAMDYFEKLKPSCVGRAVSYEDRVATRKSEIESLNEALKILSGDDVV